MARTLRAHVYTLTLPNPPSRLPPPSVRCLPFLRFPSTLFFLRELSPSRNREKSRRGRDRVRVYSADIFGDWNWTGIGLEFDWNSSRFSEGPRSGGERGLELVEFQSIGTGIGDWNWWNSSRLALELYRPMDGPVRDITGLLGWRRLFRAVRHIGRKSTTWTPSAPRRPSWTPAKGARGARVGGGVSDVQ